MPTGQAPQGVRRTRFVVWHQATNRPRPQLWAALSRPEVRVFRCDNAAHAMAHLCSIDPRVRARPDESTVLLLVEPDLLDGLAELLTLRERYAPAGAVWVYESAGNPQLRVARPEELAAWKSRSGAPQPDPTPPQPRVRPGVAPPLRLIGEGTLPPPKPEPSGEIPAPEPDVKFRPGGGAAASAGTVPNTPPEAPLSAMLTPEELAMLLALEPGKSTST